VKLDTWLERWPDANWGLVPTRAFIVDLDVKNGKQGFESIEETGWLPLTFIVATPSLGLHYYFAPNGSIPYQTRNGLLPGIDVRYGPDGYVVLPYSKTADGPYEVLYDIPEVRSKGSNASQPLLTPIPEWIKELLSGPEGDSPKTPYCRVQNATTDISDIPEDWTGISDRTRYMFFRNRTNCKIWNCSPVRSMKDTSQSAFENQLAIRWMNVGATDGEVALVYRVWCRKHKLRRKEDRFVTRILPDARKLTADYVAAWQSKQPVRRKRGTTNQEIMDAIRTGVNRPKDIAVHCGFKIGTVKSQLKRLTDVGRLKRTPNGYTVIEVIEQAA